MDDSAHPQDVVVQLLQVLSEVDLDGLGEDLRRVDGATARRAMTGASMLAEALTRATFGSETVADVLGTEISETATQFPMTIQWDFHEVKPEWLSAFDIVFSNSWDHSYDPRLAFSRWLSCVAKGGALVLEWSKVHGDTEPSGRPGFL